ncbi:thymidine kinase 2, mitochondrial-like [Aplysia californica]|uniref:Thymidine kinase 2, mitochondrial-like n=1 Tax=Aplysia californica TaxID=6500 RepID=A0ABM1AAC8_APLCA|nr:thymidine kinase 2, mitochondrial-like [Aplysia californica]
MPPLEFEILNECHNWVNENEDIHVDLIVYLRASPEVCSKRIQKRNRSEEAGVPMEYLESLHRLHDEWLLHGKRGKLPAPVLVIDADKDHSELQTKLESLRQDILGGLAETLSFSDDSDSS